MHLTPLLLGACLLSIPSLALAGDFGDGGGVTRVKPTQSAQPAQLQKLVGYHTSSDESGGGGRPPPECVRGPVCFVASPGSARVTPASR
jgi:hypothetical protein